MHMQTVRYACSSLTGALEGCQALLQWQLPAEYYQLVLGRQMKQSCCLYPDVELKLDEAEESMLGAQHKPAPLP